MSDQSAPLLNDADASDPQDAWRLESTEFPPDEFPDPPQTPEDLGRVT